jgi:hypothetical protein
MSERPDIRERERGSSDLAVLLWTIAALIAVYELLLLAAARVYGG